MKSYLSTLSLFTVCLLVQTGCAQADHMPKQGANQARPLQDLSRDQSALPPTPNGTLVFKGCSADPLAMPDFSNPDYYDWTSRTCNYFDASANVTFIYWKNLKSADSSDAFLNQGLVAFNEVAYQGPLKVSALPATLSELDQDFVLAHYVGVGKLQNPVTWACSSEYGEIHRPVVGLVSQSTLSDYQSRYLPVDPILSATFYSQLKLAEDLRVSADHYLSLESQSRVDDPKLVNAYAAVAQPFVNQATTAMKQALRTEIYLHTLRYAAFRAGACHYAFPESRDLNAFLANEHAANLEVDFLSNPSKIPAQVKNPFGAIPVE